MARPVARALGQEVDLEVALLRPAAQIAVADQTVEIEGRRGPGIGLDAGQLRQAGEPVGCRLEHALGRLQAAAARQVDHHLDLGLVVEGQELDRHALGIEEAAGRDGGPAHQEQEDPGSPAPGEQRRGDQPVESAEPAAATAVTFAAPRRLPA